jgi:hypothetical protein
MGTYAYTLRAKTKTVADIEIGHYEYAYRCGWRCGPGCGDRVIDALCSRAEDAEHRNKHVRHFVLGKFERASEHPKPIYRIDRAPAGLIIEEIRGSEIIGYLVKRKGRYVIENPVTAIL